MKVVDQGKWRPKEVMMYDQGVWWRLMMKVDDESRWWKSMMKVDKGWRSKLMKVDDQSERWLLFKVKDEKWLTEVEEDTRCPRCVRWEKLVDDWSCLSKAKDALRCCCYFARGEMLFCEWRAKVREMASRCVLRRACWEAVVVLRVMESWRARWRADVCMMAGSCWWWW